jgi:GDP-4-dehydro-6-deoxy-D-mannose reductase
MSGSALITGAAGFAGRVLAAHLTQQGWSVRQSDVTLPEGADPAGWRACDIADPDSVNTLTAWAAPVSHVFHLAAVTFVPETIQRPARAFEINLNGTVHLAAAMRKRLPQARLIFVSSSEVYGPPQYLPVDEHHPFNPINPYAIAKAAADRFCAFYHASEGLDVVRLRPSNHSGPGQAAHFVLSSFARQIARIEAGIEEPVLRVGNLEAARDFLHVSDVVRAYELAARKGRPGTAYNICSGTAVRIQDALNQLLAMAKTDIRIAPDPERMRPADVPEIRGSAARLSADTGWRPEKSFADLLRDVLDYWRGRVSP